MSGETGASTYVGTNNLPLTLHVKVSYPLSLDGKGERLIDRWQLTNIVKNEKIIRRVRSSGTPDYMAPLQLSIASETADAGYANFIGLMATFRFRRVPRKKNA